ncbi:MAG: LUD domain-containing protein [Thermoguttaceae bacterium]
MNSRDTILQRLRTHLSGGPPVAPPPVAEVWPRQAADKAVLAERFAEELKAIFGEAIRCPSMAEAQRQLAALMESAAWPTIGAVDCPAVREAAAALPPERVEWVGPDWTPQRIAQLPAGLIAADALLADTGSCMIACGSTHERLMCYLPPNCVVVGRAAQLAEHLPAAWAEIAGRCHEPALRGEFLLVTGPSRTADIEKILILGVHGPTRLVVLLVE